MITMFACCEVGAVTTTFVAMFGDKEAAMAFNAINSKRYRIMVAQVEMLNWEPIDG